MILVIVNLREKCLNFAAYYKKNRFMRKLIGIMVFSALFVACGSPEKKNEEVVDTPVEQPQEDTTSNVIDLKGSDDMKYDNTAFTVKANQEITLNFTNAGTLPIESMGHNVVVLEPGTDVAEFANASVKAKDTDYISDLYVTDIIAHTKILGPGESETIKFTLKPGTYTFVCTFPGHWAQMQGTITAE